MTVQAGQTIRLRIGSEATVRFFRLRLTGSDGTNTVQIPLVRVGGENGLLDKAHVEGGVVSGFDFGYDKGEVLLDPGDRVDVVATFPATATGVFTLWTKSFVRQGSGGPTLPTVPVAHFKINGSIGAAPTITDGTPILSSLGAGAEVEVLGAPTATLIDPGTFSPAKPGMPNQDIQLTNHASASLGINQVIGEHDFSGDYTVAPRPGVPGPSSARWAKLGDTLELTVTNMTGAHHPFHLHGFSMQPISLTDTMSGPPPAPNGGGDKSPGIGPPYTFPYHEFRDTIDIPPGYTLTFRVRLDDRFQTDGVTMGGGLGRWVFHCHIFFHASFGMISEFDVVNPSGNERPYINADGTDLSGNSGDTLTMHGTYVDPDGDTPIALSASTGSITDDGDGKHWTWTGSASASTLVYVTATDPSGLNGQTAFGLKINVPPVLTVPGPQTQDYHDPLSFSVSATDADNDPITLSVTGLPANLNFVDNGNGTGNVSGTLNVIPGVYTATFAASDGHNPPVKKDVKITVTKEETATVYTGPTVILNGGNVTLSATLKEDGTVPIAGRTVNFTLGAQVCSGTTLATGVASCTLATNSQLGSSIPITATFAGDAFYLPSSASATAVVFAFPPGGAFVVGDTSAGSGGVGDLVGQLVGEGEYLLGRHRVVRDEGVRAGCPGSDEHAARSLRRAMVDDGRNQPATALVRHPVVHGRVHDEQCREVGQRDQRQYREHHRRADESGLLAERGQSRHRNGDRDVLPSVIGSVARVGIVDLGSRVVRRDLSQAARRDGSRRPPAPARRPPCVGNPVVRACESRLSHLL